MSSASNRLCKHGDFQHVYKACRKRFSKQMSYFFLLRQPAEAEGSTARNTAPTGPRIGLTVGKIMGKAVDRNRIKRRMRAAVRRQLRLLHSPVDIVLHPRRSVIDLDFATLERDLASVFQQIQRASQQPAPRAAEAD